MALQVAKRNLAELQTLADDCQRMQREWRALTKPERRARARVYAHVLAGAHAQARTCAGEVAMVAGVMLG